MKLDQDAFNRGVDDILTLAPLRKAVSRRTFGWDVDWRNWTLGVEASRRMLVICLGPVLISWSDDTLRTAT